MKTEHMKKEYEAPSLRCTVIEMESGIAAGSGGGGGGGGGRSDNSDTSTGGETIYL